MSDYDAHDVPGDAAELNAWQAQLHWDVGFCRADHSWSGARCERPLGHGVLGSTPGARVHVGYAPDPDDATHLTRWSWTDAQCAPSLAWSARLRQLLDRHPADGPTTRENE